jgi:hypothetical protein
MKKNNAYITKIAGFMEVSGEKTISSLQSEKLINSSRDWNFIKRKVIQIAVKSPASRIVVHSPIKEFCLSKGED